MEQRDENRNKTERVGIPRALLYHKYGKLWEVFLRELGVEVIISPETNKEIVSRGARLSIDESCLSVKIFIGHVNWLRDKVDAVLVPNITCLKHDEEMCAKFMALVDMTRNIFPGIKIIEYTVNAESFKTEFLGMVKMGMQITGNPFKTAIAYLKAKKVWYQQIIEKNKKQVSELRKFKDEKKTSILIVSHNYTTYDNFLGKPIIDCLKKLDAGIIYSDKMNADTAKKLSKNISTTLYWSYHKELLGAVEFYKNDVDGIIFLTTFPCGPDALAVTLCQSKLENIPSIIITLDELESRVGLQTRLESFVDVINLKKCRQKK